MQFDWLALTWANMVFVGVTILWWLEFRIFPSRDVGTDDGRKSYRTILYGVLGTILISVTGRFVGLGGFPPSWFPAMQIIGLGMYTMGIVLRYWCSFLLGVHFTRGVKVADGQKLVSHGPYRVLRHPLYLGLLLLGLGVPVFLGSAVGFLVGLIVLPRALVRRIAIEESQLIDALGEEYEKWMRARYRLFPLIY